MTELKFLWLVHKTGNSLKFISSPVLLFSLIFKTASAVTNLPNFAFKFPILQTFQFHCGGCQASYQITTERMNMSRIDMVSKVGAVIRAFASYQHCPGLNPNVDTICGLSLLLVVSLVLRGFSLCTLVFPLFSKTNISKFQLDQELGRQRTS